MTKWEYLRIEAQYQAGASGTPDNFQVTAANGKVTTPYKGKNIDDVIASLGDKGWELIVAPFGATGKGYFYLKREKAGS